MADPVSLPGIAITSGVTLLVPVVTHLISGRKGRQATLLARLKEVSEIVKNLPEDSLARDSLLNHSQTMAGRYAEIESRAATLKREPGAIALGVALAVAGANLSVQALNHGGLWLWWLALGIPLFLIGMFGATYEAAGGKSRDHSPPAQLQDPMDESKRHGEMILDQPEGLAGQSTADAARS